MHIVGLPLVGVGTQGRISDAWLGSSAPAGDAWHEARALKLQEGRLKLRFPENGIWEGVLGGMVKGARRTHQSLRKCDVTFPRMGREFWSAVAGGTVLPGTAMGSSNRLRA